VVHINVCMLTLPCVQNSPKTLFHEMLLPLLSLNFHHPE
jgi:hypothetical protein